MPHLIPLDLDGTTIYIQAVENTNIPNPPDLDPELDFLDPTTQESEARDLNPRQQVAKSFKTIETTVRTYTTHLLNSIKNLAVAEVSEVTLEFGVNVGGMTGIPYIATGSTDCNVKITVKCEFPTQTAKKD